MNRCKAGGWPSRQVKPVAVNTVAEVPGPRTLVFGMVGKFRRSVIDEDRYAPSRVGWLMGKSRRCRARTFVCRPSNTICAQTKRRKECRQARLADKRGIPGSSIPAPLRGTAGVIGILAGMPLGPQDVLEPWPDRVSHEGLPSRCRLAA